jgi:hypothetical protein
MKISLFLLVAFCMLISSCQKEGPLGFKTGQEYEYRHKDTTFVIEVVDAGKDWVDFESSTGNRMRRTKDQIGKELSSFRLK